MSHASDEGVWAARLREAGLRATGTRMDILRALAAAPSPMNAQEVLSALPGAGADRVTVYRTLNSFVKAGLAHRIDPGDRVWRFGLNDVGHADHAHFVCDACGAVECLENAAIRVLIEGGSRSRTARITQRDVYLHGQCDRCARSA
jgi:Fur family ferric uptake transcriptional regulator